MPTTSKIDPADVKAVRSIGENEADLEGFRDDFRHPVTVGFIEMGNLYRKLAATYCEEESAEALLDSDPTAVRPELHSLVAAFVDFQAKRDKQAVEQGKTPYRYRFWRSSPNGGGAWATGRLSRSCGPFKSPILVSEGERGGPILDFTEIGGIQFAGLMSDPIIRPEEMNDPKDSFAYKHPAMRPWLGGFEGWRKVDDLMI